MPNEESSELRGWIFVSQSSLFLIVWIRIQRIQIHKVPEYGSNLDLPSSNYPIFDFLFATRIFTQPDCGDGSNLYET